MKKLGRAIFLVLACIAILMSAMTCFANEDPALQRMISKLTPAVALIYTKVDAQISTKGFGEIAFRPYRTSGTGFIISQDGYLVTNGHVVAAYQGIDDTKIGRYFHKQLNPTVAKMIDEHNLLRKIRLKKSLHVIISNGESFVAEIKQFSPPVTPQPGKYSEISVAAKPYIENTETGKDIAVLKIEGRDLPTVPLGDSNLVQRGETIYVIGYPGVVTDHDYLSEKTRLDSTVTIGHVSGSKLDVKGTPVIQTDASLTWGNSGGPAFNSKGEVVGIPTFISIDSSTGQAIQGFNFLVPSNTAMEFVRAAGVNLGAESLFNKLWGEALALHAIPDRDKTLSKIDEVNRIVPNLPDVRKLQLAAQRMPPTPPKSRLTSPTTLLITAGILISGGLLWAFFLRNRKPSPATSPAPTATVAVTPVTRAMTMAATPAAVLACTDGPLAGRTFPITAGGVKIGRDPSRNQIVIDNDGISREHAAIHIEDGKAVLRDFNSLNGTFITSTNNERISNEVLKDGDVIIIGKGRFATFTFSQS